MQRSLLRPQLPAAKQLAVILASLGMLIALPAAATVVDGLSAQGTAQVTGNSAVVVGPVTTLPYASIDANDSNGTSSSSASAWGHANGPYRAGAEGTGAFDSTGHFIRSWSITNDSGVAQHYAFNFFIYYGSMGTDLGSGGDGYAEYLVNITRDGSTNLFNSSAKIESNGALTEGGTQLNGASQSGSYYSWGGTSFNIDLGILNNGESTTVDYDLVSHAYGNYAIGSGCNGYGGYGYGAADVYGGSCTGSSYASLGDPDSLNETPIPGVGFVVTAAQVPEPATLALVGLGLAGLGWRRRRPRSS
ncbi:PEP-CTERM sorting domain-containing protein [Accumulibacter sp.]|uniref:PEP-CTERM sorting domain-containing protein n=1 Tax=Accumulibacter sp. TaxID=2053492 RepID=UPI0028C46539|nr:PEP-CTERM sorting domain-containing protein [Accumulibacter sp.]